MYLERSEYLRGTDFEHVIFDELLQGNLPFQRREHNHYIAAILVDIPAMKPSYACLTCMAVGSHDP